MKAKELWQKYLLSNMAIANEGVCQECPESWAFGDAPDKLVQLVLDGKKTGTSSSYLLYEITKDKVPAVNDLSIILDSQGEAKCIIRTTKTYILPFNEVPLSHAIKEGEGDLSLEYWRMVHEKFLKDCLEEYGLKFSLDTLVLCEEFEVIYK
ncbi:MAG: hypothetical protein BHW12_06450 [Coprobacillus sp. 28_7]|mgnify:FL=1|nr:MAG: hypothetical protein BHW12_06450 [Coprobacillus sp. 28_7]CCY07943.1 putative uncharacterized protein [Coprobacillus sp. CAG:698]